MRETIYEVQALYDGQWENPATYTGDSQEAFHHEERDEARRHLDFLLAVLQFDDVRVIRREHGQAEVVETSGDSK